MKHRIQSVALLLAWTIFSATAQGDEPLPRVLLIGDSVYGDMSRTISGQLSGRVEVIYPSLPKGVVLNSSSLLERIESILGDEEWDLIHFNCGLGDLVYRAPDMNSFRLLPVHAGGVRATRAEEYEANLRELVSRLQQTDANLVWASTTPIRHSSTNVFQPGSEQSYNEIANQVMEQNGVPVNDMYSYVFEQLDMERPAAHGADPFFFDRKPIHEQVVATILAALDLPPDSNDE